MFPNNPDNRFCRSTVSELNKALEDEGMAAGLDVYSVVLDVYAGYLGDQHLAEAQLCSMYNSWVRKEFTGE